MSFSIIERMLYDLNQWNIKKAIRFGDKQFRIIVYIIDSPYYLFLRSILKFI